MQIKFALIFVTFFISSAFSEGCEIGIIKIEKGTWVNKEIIYKNIDKCYAGNQKEIDELKIRYNKSAEDNILDYLKAEEKYSKSFSRYIEISKQIPYTPLILGIFSDSIKNGKKYYDTLQEILNLDNNQISGFDAWEKQKRAEYLESMWRRFIEYKLYARLFEAPVPNFVLDSIYIPDNVYGLNRITDTSLIDPGQYLEVYLNFIRRSKGSSDNRKALKLSEKNRLLKIIYESTMCLDRLSYYDSVLVNADTIKNITKDIAQLDLKNREIVYENNFVFDLTVRPLITVVSKHYDKLVVNQTKQTDMEKGRNDFKVLFPRSEFSPIFMSLETYLNSMNNRLYIDTYTKMKRMFGE